MMKTIDGLGKVGEIVKLEKFVFSPLENHEGPTLKHQECGCVCDGGHVHVHGNDLLSGSGWQYVPLSH